jgi:hypothetical protein
VRVRARERNDEVREPCAVTPSSRSYLHKGDSCATVRYSMLKDYFGSRDTTVGQDLFVDSAPRGAFAAEERSGGDGTRRVGRGILRGILRTRGVGAL